MKDEHARGFVPVLLAAALLTLATHAVAANKYIFTTSSTGTGNLSTWLEADGHTGLAAADNVCRMRATEGGFPHPSTYVAWMSDANNDAYCRASGFSGKKSANCGQATLPTNAGPWVRVDGFPFSPTLGAMTYSNAVYVPSNRDEFDELLSTSSAWTGTGPDGTWTSTNHCNNWTSTAAGVYGTVGDVQGTSVVWTSATIGKCYYDEALICLEPGAGSALSNFAQPGRLAFATSVLGTGKLSSNADSGGKTGLAAADAICQARAAAGGLAHSETFKAWLSSGSTSAASRFLSDGRWVRPDGVPIADDKVDLLDGQIFSSIHQDEHGYYRGGSLVWTGSTWSGEPTGTDCTGWTSNSGAVGGSVGFMGYVDARWTDYIGSPCSYDSAVLYCLSDLPTLTVSQGSVRVGSPITLPGAGITAGTVLKAFVATSAGPVDVMPAGLAPTSTTSTSWTGTLPWTWPVGGNNANLLGNGFVTLQLIATDAGYAQSNALGAVLFGNPSMHVPSLISIAGTSLSSTSYDTKVATANVQGMLLANTFTVLGGDGFENPVVNIFTAQGNLGPITPTSFTSTSITFKTPLVVPIGPGSVQVVNTTNFQPSDAVSIPIGEAISVGSVTVNGSTITVNGSGFNSLTAINLFATQQGSLTNVGGLDANGASKIPLTLVSNHKLTFTRPAGLTAGKAYVQALNPPYITYTSSGSGAGGAFTLP